MMAWIDKYLVLLKVALAAILLVAAYSFGHHVASQAAAVAQAKALHDQDVANQAELQRRIAETSANAQQGSKDTAALQVKKTEAQAKFKIIYRDINHYVDTHPTPASCDLDADGLRAWNGDANGAPPAGAAHTSR